MVVFDWTRPGGMAKAKVMVISGPMDAKHIGGVNVMAGAQQSGIDAYFKSVAIAPDELPSHTFVATGRTEISIPSAIRRPSLSLKRSLSKLRKTSLSNIADAHIKLEGEHNSTTAIRRTESARSQKPLRMQSSLTRLRQRVGLDRDLYANAPTNEANVRRPDTAPAVDRLDPYLALRSVSTTPEPEPSIARHITPRQPPPMQQPSAVVKRKPSAAIRDFPEKRPPFQVPQKPSMSQITAAGKSQPPSRPKRADSGTVIDFKRLPVDERPLGFQDILAVNSFKDRMKEYERARQYWAHAEHGLVEWTQAALKPRLVPNYR